ncbi:hypothetical protein MRY87_02955 [bacterium]|nr:hypothetical protein [bacterium]
MARYLLLQFRAELAVSDEERETFARQAEIPIPEIAVRNYLRAGADSPLLHEDLEDLSGVFIGGASTVSASQLETSPLLQQAAEDLSLIIERDIPTLASCFGFQLGARILGKELHKSEEEQESGSLFLELSREGEQDPLLQTLRDRETGKSGGFIITVHREGLRTLPEGTVRLVKNNYWEQAYRIRGKRFWAFQGHPELDFEAVKGRLWVYKNEYDLDDAAYEKILAQFRHHNEANDLLKVFCELHSS